MSRTGAGSGWAVGIGLAFAAACTLGDGETPDFSSFGGTDATPTSDDSDDDDDDADDDADASTAGDATGGGTTAAVDGGSTTTATTADDDDDDDVDVTTSTTDGGTTDPTTDGGATTDLTTGGATTDPTTGGSESSSSGGGMPGDDYEPCNPDGTCDTPGEVCLQVGVGGFCTETCGSDAECPPTPPGTTLQAGCEFLLGFPDFGADYCGMIGCNFIFNDCPAGMTCTPVVMGLTVCEWV